MVYMKSFLYFLKIFLKGNRWDYVWNSSSYKSAYDVANRVIKQANTYKEWLKEKRDEAERLRKEHIAEIKKRDQSAAKRTNEAVKLNE